MKNYRLITIALLLLLLGGSVFHFIRKSLSNDKLKIQAALEETFEEAKLFSQVKDVIPYSKASTLDVQTENEILLGIGVLTTDIAPEIVGYAGSIKILVGLETDGSIKRIKMISHSETPSYVLDLDLFLDQFLSKPLNDNFQLDADLDGISRATITSEAITRAVEKSAKLAASSILNIPVELSTPAAKPYPYDEIIMPIILFAVALGGILMKNTLLRWSALIGGFIYFGILKSTMVSSVQIANIFLWKLPTFEQNPLWYMLVGLTIITTFLFGMVYCGSLCPFASVQELLYKIFHRKYFRNEDPIPFKKDQKFRNLKYITLFVILIASFILGNSSAASIEPFLTLFTFKGSTLAWGLLALMLLAACFHFRFWCKYLCPVGASLGLIARLSPFKIRLGEGCIHCDKCDRVCPTRAIKMDVKNIPIIDYPECILCNKCIETCPNKSLLMSAQRHHHEK